MPQKYVRLADILLNSHMLPAQIQQVQQNTDYATDRRGPRAKKAQFLHSSSIFLQIYKKNTIFALYIAKKECTRSSMDRISDSGSDDWGSTPHGCTIYRSGIRAVFYSKCVLMEIVILDGYVANPGDLSWDKIARLGNLTVYNRTMPNEIVERCKDAVAVFTNKVMLDGQTLLQLKSLKFIGVLATGYNNIDIDAATQLGITVCNVPSYSTESVAQTVFALLLEITNKVGEYSAAVSAGAWSNCRDFSFTLGPITELSGRTMGVYGLGNIGKRVAEIANAFGMHVISPTSQSADTLPGYITKVSFDDFLASSDVISINSPLTETNRHIFNSDNIAKTRPGVIIINTARGPIIDEHAVANALTKGHIGAVGVDVLEQEPPRNGSPLIGAPRCYITPHVAWQSTDARKRLIEISANNLAEFIAGHPINKIN